MSGGPGGGVPECAYNPASGIIVPRSGDSFDVGKSLNITWSGGPVQKGARLTDIFDIVLAHGNDTADMPRWEKKIFSSKAFIFESDRKGRDGVWTNFDICNNTAFYQLWTISADLDFSSTSFRLIVKNVTTDAEGRSYISSPFTIRENVASTTTSLIASPGISGATSSPSTSVPPVAETPEPDLQLSTGAKAGIGVGAALAVILLLLAGWLWRRRKVNQNQDASAEAAEGYQKPELDGRHVQSPATEIDGPEIVEVEGDDVVKQETPGDPVELPTENFNRES